MVENSLNANLKCAPNFLNLLEPFSGLRRLKHLGVECRFLSRVEGRGYYVESRG